MVYLRDSASILATPIQQLFQKIYQEKRIPDQWKIGKITPIPKKGNPKEVSNYRPITSICSLAKVFERCILQHILKLGDFTGTKQHGFKINHSTITALLDLQHEVSTSLDAGKYHGVLSLDLSAAFDMVDTKLLIKRMEIAGLPNDVTSLVEDWLTGRTAYVEIGGECSNTFPIPDGTVQGSVLGPLLFAIFIAPMFELVNVSSFADDSYLSESDHDLETMVQKLQTEANVLMGWFKSSGLVVNETKTEICIFHKTKKIKKTFIIGNENIESSTTLRALGVILDCNLNWESHINNLAKTCIRLNFGFKLLKKYFNQEELLKLATAIFYAKLYYASVVWLLPSLTINLQKTMMTLSAMILKTITGATCNEVDKLSYYELHRATKRATPNQMMKYVQATNLHRIMTSKTPENVYLDLLVHHIENRRHYKPSFTTNNSSRVGFNIFRNRIRAMCNEISSDMTLQTFNQLKINAKKDFLTFSA